jgi:ADP-ribosylglycohydrolase
MRGVAPRDSGVASGLLNTSVQCGAALGIAALAAIASAVTRNQQTGHAYAVALTHGYSAGLLAGAAIYTAAAIVAALTINARLSAGQLAGH